MPLPPLTHHEILTLVGPFSRSGRRVDLEATDRVARRLVFMPVVKQVGGEGGAPGAPGHRERLELENPYAGVYSLTRTVTADGSEGPTAKLVAEGPEPAALLALVDAVPTQRQLREEAGYRLACSHKLVAGPGVTPEGAAERLLLTSGEVRTGGLTLLLRTSPVGGYPADLELRADGEFIPLPEDLLSVVGWDWAPLKRVGALWQSKLRLRGKEPARSRSAEEKLLRTAQHLAQTLAAPPPQFHQRFAPQRWFAVVRRIIPLLTCLGLVGVVLAIPAEFINAHPAIHMMMFNAPLLVIALSFTLQESARVELPPLPRPSTAASWRVAPAAPSAPGAQQGV
jgi:hypothetical protein